MKALTISIAVAALLALGASQALARPSHAQAMKTVTVVMHDPGCHWFGVGSAMKTKLSVKGPVKLRNLDEAALKVAGAKGAKLDGVGKELVLARGVYHITMVGQAPDDNHLKLVVT
jgi:hypothetical protein